MNHRTRYNPLRAARREAHLTRSLAAGHRVCRSECLRIVAGSRLTAKFETLGASVSGVGIADQAYDNSELVGALYNLMQRGRSNGPDVLL